MRHNLAQRQSLGSTAEVTVGVIRSFHSSLHEFGFGADNVDDDLGKGLPFPVDTAERHQRWLLTWSPHSGVSFCGPTVTAEEDEQ